MPLLFAIGKAHPVKRLIKACPPFVPLINVGVIVFAEIAAVIFVKVVDYLAIH